jgi:23S rRNA (adenine2503-C2)-methyltransferase
VRLSAGTLGGVDLDLLRDTFAALGEPRFRGRQVWQWAARGATGYAEMTSLPAALRAELATAVPFSTLTVEREARARDGTEKVLFATRDGLPLEAVLMRYRDGRRSLCLSSQSGCPLTCSFCATGRMRFGRNLTASEILDQALHFRRREPIDHVVFMGMGEPLINLDAVLAVCERLPDLGLTARRTAISTVGWIPGIERLAGEGPPVRLALSLHAPEDALRSELMPVNERYPLRDVLAACRRWAQARRQPVFVEYLMLEGVNDRYEQAVALAGLLGRDGAFKVNLIPYNPTDAGFAGSSRAAIDAFRAALAERGVTATVRLTRGRDIDAACCGRRRLRAARGALGAGPRHRDACLGSSNACLSGGGGTSGGSKQGKEAPTCLRTGSDANAPARAAAPDARGGAAVDAAEATARPVGPRLSGVSRT